MKQFLILNTDSVVDPDGIVPTPEFGAKTYYLARFLPKTA